jgi:signal transduction histidine kinase
MARRKDGSEVPVEISLSSVEGADGQLVIAILRDVSERRAVERQQREFIAMVSHELMNPVTGIGLHAELLQMTESYSEPAVNGIMISARRLERLIGDLLDVSRLEAGRLKLQPRWVDLVALARTAIGNAQASTKQHQIRLSVLGTLQSGWWDPIRLEQVLANLLSNAIKYSPAGGPIDVTIKGLPDQVRVTVADRGSGIASEALVSVFDLFYRARDTERHAQGLGLGLYITRSLVEAQGGRIEVESEPGRGTAFRFALPYVYLPQS